VTYPYLGYEEQPQEMSEAAKAASSARVANLIQKVATGVSPDVGSNYLTKQQEAKVTAIRIAESEFGEANLAKLEYQNIISQGLEGVGTSIREHIKGASNLTPELRLAKQVSISTPSWLGKLVDTTLRTAPVTSTVMRVGDLAYTGINNSLRSLGGQSVPLQDWSVGSPGKKKPFAPLSTAFGKTKAGKNLSDVFAVGAHAVEAAVPLGLGAVVATTAGRFGLGVLEKAIGPVAGGWMATNRVMAASEKLTKAINNMDLSDSVTVTQTPYQPPSNPVDPNKPPSWYNQPTTQLPSPITVKIPETDYNAMAAIFGNALRGALQGAFTGFGGDGGDGGGDTYIVSGGGHGGIVPMGGGISTSRKRKRKKKNKKSSRTSATSAS